MNRSSLQQLYAEHTGKVSDKWSLYLTEYDRLFDCYRDNPIHLLEIGVQNGGSLEIWSKYFSNALALIGCDINQGCASLRYDDPRICIVVGDANAPEIYESLCQRVPHFDIVIDDGSHLSSDIIKSFSFYFPHIADGGVFVAEDLHCSYWQQLQGGLFDPYSSIAFFKRLADVINHEHWGVSKGRSDVLKGIFTKYGCTLDEDLLSQVHSVEFINSMCVVRKAPATDNGLGRRVIAGSVESVIPGHLDMHGYPYQLAPNLEQSQNPWTVRSIPPDEVIQQTELELAEAKQKIANINSALGERETQIASLNQAVDHLLNSTSWRLTKPVRIVGHKLKQFYRILVLSGSLFSNLKNLKNIVLALKRNGLNHALHYHQLLQSEENAAQISKDRGLSPETIRALVVLGTLFIRIKQWWFTSNFRREFSGRLAIYFHGGTEASNNSAHSHIRFHIDKPGWLFNIVGDSFVISGWCVDLDACTGAKARLRIGNVIHVPHLKQREDVQHAFSSVCELPLDVGFSAVPSLSWGLHRMWVDLEGPKGTWIPVHRSLLLRVPKISHWQRRRRPTYQVWTGIEQNRLKAELQDITRHIDVMIHKPIFTIIIDTRNSVVGLEKSLHAMRKQIYPHYEMRVLTNVDCVVPTLLKQEAKSLRDTSLSDVAGDFIIIIEGGQCLSSNALYEFANALNQYPDLDLIYGDQDRLNASGKRLAPFYKPDWSPDYLESFNYIGFPSCFRTTIARSCFSGTHLYDLVLRFTEHTTKIWHVNKMLGHQSVRQDDDETFERIVTQNIAALEGRLSRTNRNGTVHEHQLHQGCYDIELDLKRRPLVSVIIPTAGKTVTIGERQIDLITNIVDQIRNYSSYKNIEIIIVDNGDLSEAQRHILAGHACQLITYTEPVFNISKKLNLGASIANGKLLLLMNDDIEILNPCWIERMVEHFEKSHVGVVGAKLLYPDGRTQHVGVVHNYGNPDHVRRLSPGNEAGYYFSTCGVRNFTAVTGAVMMTPLDIYRAVGGYSEALAVSYNDTDYCLKVQDKGLWIVYAPMVELTHMESQSRVASADMNEVRWYHKRWAPSIVSDRYYNELYLNVAPPTFMPCVNRRLL